MPRSAEQARRRLQQAALELYGRHGFERTTTAQIAASAGFTERTFFRHFADKREVLFGGEDLVRGVLVGAVDDAPAGASPMDALRLACCALVPALEETRRATAARHAIIERTPVLLERELAKLDSLADSLAHALARRGVPTAHATLASRVAMTILRTATTHWYEDATADVRTCIEHAFDDAADLVAAPPERAVRLHTSHP